VHAATQAKRRHIVRHKVIEKQKIEEVAKMFGVTVTEIVLWNSLENTRLVGGQTLKIELSTDSSKTEGDK
jgi:LysM repeat protein